jgi:chitin synthase
MRKSLIDTRYFTYVFISLWKMLVFFATMLFSVWILGHNVGNTFTQFTNSFGDHQINVTEVRAPINSGPSPDIPGGSFLEEVIKEKSVTNLVRNTLYLQILAAYVTYIFGKFACKICIQGFSFAFPVSLAVPVTLSLLISLCGLRSESPCFWESVLPQYLFWTCPKGEFISDFIGKEVRHNPNGHSVDNFTRTRILLVEFSVWLDMAALASIPDLDRTSHLDTEM